MIALVSATLEKGSFKLGPIDRVIKKGERICLMGKNGSGKTSLLDLISGVEKAGSGTLSSDETISYSPQESDDSFFMPSVMDEFSYSMRGAKKKEAREKAISLLSLAGLDASYLEKSPFSLSGGEKRLLSIALSLVNDPTFILLDEVLSSLDYSSMRSFRALLSFLSEKHTGYILVSHSVDILDLFDSILVLSGGKILFDGTPLDAMASGIIDKSFTYRKSEELYRKPFLSYDELLRRADG